MNESNGGPPRLSGRCSKHMNDKDNKAFNRLLREALEYLPWRFARHSWRKS